MKMLLVDVFSEKVFVVDAETLQDYCNFLKCDSVDICLRQIGTGGGYFSVICDDDGWLSDCPKISAVDRFLEVAFVGNLLISGQTDGNGNLMPLSNEDVSYLRKHIKRLVTEDSPKGYPVLTQID